MDPRLVLATHNPAKVAELIDILRADPTLTDLDPTTVVRAAHYGATPPVEDGSTFAENALIKARSLAKETGIPAVADDSGLCVDIMGGAPGIFSARWSGHHGDDPANLRLLIGQLAEHLDLGQRRAKFVCAAALVTPDGQETVCEGEMLGYLVTEPRGIGGFGYDPIFVPDDQPTDTVRTSAELSPKEKNAISHRGKALRKLAPAISAALI